jgi:uncharacterized C2H2 Zn-finger protein
MPEFKCEACGMQFPTQEALMQHNSAAHAQPQAGAQFKCQACGATFSSQAELQAHGKSAHAM